MEKISTRHLEVSGLNIGYKTGASTRIVCGDINFTIHAGELLSLLGRNGAGKSTLIKTLAGILPALLGNIRINEIDLCKLTQLEIAKNLSLVLTDRIESGYLTAYDLVALGRGPYTGWLGRLSPNDIEKIEWAIEITGIEKHRKHKFGELSDGERQTVLIARALAQDTALIILDEPTAHLDLPNKIAIFRLLRKLTWEAEKSILISTHELELALQASDKIGLMDSEGGITVGVTEELVANGSFEKVFNKDGIVFDKTSGSFRTVGLKSPFV